jgi:hypothetical protein
MKPEKHILKQILAEKLILIKVFWSYTDVKSADIPDRILIEKVLIYLDVGDINSLFMIFPFKTIKEVWRNEVVIQNPIYYSLNLLLAYLYFHIKNPEKYIEKLNQRHLLAFQ